MSDLNIVNTILNEHSEKIIENKNHIESEIKDIKENYLDRFDDLKDYIKETVIKSIDNNRLAIIQINKSITGLFWSVIGLNFTAVGFLILNGIFKWITF